MNRVLLLLLSLFVSPGLLVSSPAQGRDTAERQRKAELVLDDLKLLDSAIDQWAIENGRSDGDLPSWNEIARFIREDNRLRVSNCRDVFGNKFIIGTVAEFASVHPQTLDALSEAVGGAKFFTRSYITSPPAPEIVLAAREGDAQRVARCLSSGADIDQKDGWGRTALYWAARMGHLNVARLLCASYRNPIAAIKAGGSITPRDTPLLEASYGHADVLELFLNCGARVDDVDLGYAIRHAEVVGLLLSRGLSPNASDNTGTPLLHLAAFAYQDSVRMLLEKGADVNAKSSRGETALDVAARGRPSNNTEIMQLLRAAGAK